VFLPLHHLGVRCLNLETVSVAGCQHALNGTEFSSKGFAAISRFCPSVGRRSPQLARALARIIREVEEI
jgi:hypothetical protein